MKSSIFKGVNFINFVFCFKIAPAATLLAPPTLDCKAPPTKGRERKGAAVVVVRERVGMSEVSKNQNEH